MHSVLKKIEKLLMLLVQRSMSRWSESAGLNTEIEYYTGVEAGNPSGETSNIKFIKYLNRDGSVHFRKELSYNIDDLSVLIEPKLM